MRLCSGDEMSLLIEWIREMFFVKSLNELDFDNVGEEE